MDTEIRPPFPSFLLPPVKWGAARSDKAWAITDAEVMNNTRKLEKIAVSLDDRLQKNENMNNW